MSFIITSFLKRAEEKLNIKEKYNKAKSMLGNMNTYTKIIIGCMGFVLFFSLLIGALPIKIVYNVVYNGNVIASVEEKDVYYKAAELAASKVNAENPDEYILNPKFKRIITFANEFANSEDLSYVILENTDNLIDGYALCVNGETVAVSNDGDGLDKILYDAKQSYLTGNGEESAEFVDDVTVLSGYYATDNFLDSTALCELVNALDVKTVVTITIDKSIGYSTVKQKSSSVAAGKTTVKQQGVNGVKRTVETIEYLNGEITNRNVVSNEVISEPVDKILVVGTGVSSSASNYSTYGFVKPIDMSKIYISSYWGDGRNHKGLDLAGPKGLSIYASKSGVVKTVRHTSDYGKYIVIDHGDGFETLYSHCSEMIVSVGEKVVAGQTIAYVGRTGNASGNHLHFEIWKNGQRVNPAPYLGIK